ncbi:MAG: HlyU family transcriptional regulator [Mesorhizobium sp.]
MSFLKRLFGGGGGGEAAEPKSSAPAKQVEHKGFLISATPYKSEGGQYQTCGIVSKEIGGVMKEHKFIRADRFAGLDDAVDISIKKGMQLVDEQGERMFG